MVTISDFNLLKIAVFVLGAVLAVFLILTLVLLAKVVGLKKDIPRL